MSPEDQQVRIDNYLLGHGSPEERREFEEEVSRNQELSEQLDGTRMAIDAIELFEDERLKRHLQDVEAKMSTGGESADAPARVAAAGNPNGPEKKEAKVVTMQPLKRSRRTLLAYAASLLLLLLAGWWIIQQTGAPVPPAQLALNSFEPYDNIASGAVRSSQDDTTEAAAYRNYDAGDYARAAELFATLPPSPPRSFYYGQSLLAQGKFAEAEEIFEPLSRLSLEEFSLMGESTYALGVSQLGSGNVAAARATLQRAAAVPGNDRAGAARALLEEL